MFTLHKYTVQDAYHYDETESYLVNPDRPFQEAVHRFATMASARGIFVLDDQGRLLGVLTRRDLLSWARSKFGAELQVAPTRIDEAMRLVSLMNAETVGDVMRPETRSASVCKDTTLAVALGLMIKLDLIVLPVIDENDRVIQDIKLSEILAFAANLDEKAVDNA